MAIVLKNKKYHVSIDSKTIIGVMGNNYREFLELITGENIFYLDNRISLSKKDVNSLVDKELIKKYDLNNDFFDSKVYELSHSDLKILKYLMLINSDKRINIIDEPFMDLDNQNKKMVTLIINNLVKEGKTVIIGSNNSNIIYSLCKKILFVNENGCYYGDITCLQNKKLLKKYNVITPDLVEFVNIAKDKKIKLKYFNDIRDLIKDVYRNVSQK